MTLVLTYHAVESGPAPLCIDPAVFARHVDAIADSGFEALTVSELAAALRAGELPERALAVTFDDGAASVAEQAAPLLRKRGLRATVFCVAGSLGGTNDWATQAGWAPRLRLAEAGALAALAADGWEIGSHGVEHLPLSGLTAEDAGREVLGSKVLLEDVLGVQVSSFAWPYGARPSAAAAELIARTYDAACAAGPAVVRDSSHPLALPRVDIHYLRSPERLRGALEREPAVWLSLRGLATRVRRAVRPDYSSPRDA
ncbi:MAG TPA: polysaccharide deacetylase family protein [Gaiellaceae bacterium]|nr:polysaccharide deacetylase family protein [Gaiellaceae bacterium]